MSKCVNFFRRFFVAFLTCVVTVISMAVAISPPVSAAGVFSPFNFYQLYQMLHGLLLGDGGGNSQTFGEWLEENMTRTIGSGNNKHVFLLTPGEKLEDMMSEASIRLALGAACTDGGAAGMLKIKHLMDSWNEVYDTSDIGEIGSFSSAYVPGMLSSNGVYFLPSGSSSSVLFSNLSAPGDSEYGVYSSKLVDFVCEKCDAIFGSGGVYILRNRGYYYFVCDPSGYDCCLRLTNQVGYKLSPNYRPDTTGYVNHYPKSDSDGYWCVSSTFGSGSAINYLITWAFAQCGITILDNDIETNGYGSDRWYYQLGSLISSSTDTSKPVSAGFTGPVYAMPAAKQLVTDTGTLSGLRLDVQAEDGTPDISAALDHAGVDSVDDLVSGVAAGTIPMSQVYEDMRVVPYVLTDVETREVVTDLNVSATDAKTKAVALDKDLSIPKDVSAVDAYQVTGKTWDPSLSKYKLPLFNFFPFCLPYDAYQFLTMLDVTPVAPVFHVDTTPLFSHTKFFHASDGYKITLDLTKYEEIFQILRAGECLAIVVGLCLISYKLIHGGD